MPSDWWGAKRFHRAGYMGANGDTVDADGPSSSKVDDKRNKNDREKGFLEDDQEALYNLTHDRATSGRKGLGTTAEVAFKVHL